MISYECPHPPAGYDPDRCIFHTKRHHTNINSFYSELETLYESGRHIFIGFIFPPDFSFDEFRIRIDKKKLEFENANFFKSVFLCKVDLSETVFAGDLGTDFRDVQFKAGQDHVILKNSEFKGLGKVDFSSATFTGNSWTDFSSAKFDNKRGVDFEGARFESGANFRGTRFTTDGPVCFRAVTFSGETGGLFSDTLFVVGGCIDFYRSSFSGTGANFENANLVSQKDINFSEIEFDGNIAVFRVKGIEAKQKISFENSTFSCTTVDFSKSVFTGDEVSFALASFLSGTVSFNAANFRSLTSLSFLQASFTSNKSIDISKASFYADGAIGFSSSRFIDIGDLNFRGTAFRALESISFSQALFENIKRIEFSGSRFCSNNDVLFNKVTFRNVTEIHFSEAGFKNCGMVTFEDMSLLSGRLLFEGRTFYNDKTVDMRKLVLNEKNRITFDGVDLIRCRFIGTYIRHFDFKEVFWTNNKYGAKWNLRRKKVYDDVLQSGLILNRKGSKDHYKVYELYNQLIIKYEETNRHHEAGDFFAGKMDMRRRGSIDRNIFIIIMLHAYKIISEYGEKPFRAFVWVLVLWAFFGLLYLSTGLENSGYSSTIAAIHRPCLSVMSLFECGFWRDYWQGLLVSFDVLTLDKLKPLYSAKAVFLKGVQTVLGISFISLFVLSMNRKFRRTKDKE